MPTGLPTPPENNAAHTHVHTKTHIGSHVLCLDEHAHMPPVARSYISASQLWTSARGAFTWIHSELTVIRAPREQSQATTSRGSRSACHTLHIFISDYNTNVRETNTCIWLVCLESLPVLPLVFSSSAFPSWLNTEHTEEILLIMVKGDEALALGFKSTPSNKSHDF